jgi:hypothetical protein
MAKVDREWFEGRLAGVSTLRLVMSQIATLGAGAFFLITNLVAGRTGWAIVFGVIVMLDLAVVLWWVWVKLSRRRDARELRGIIRRG